ncbi:DUF3570 domain-containing protein [Undibacterium sp. TS12]|uniref:DUF3570 domain-containing protein n=1 Tax=Undibacterium sp. TS12 TaxID=2908202 RepID=UPI001F4C9E68|nr:DUF3570 domain-containing protein [Undibacterium sp. TS12]MCH8621514.1 DUF3570 domain-containing protein [Undibacterium sp. TS12]
MKPTRLPSPCQAKHAGDKFVDKPVDKPVGKLGLTLMAAALALPMIRTAHAETAPDKGEISLKILDYQDSQPGEDRVKVKANALKVMAPLNEEWSVGATFVTDSISGASPSFHSYGLSKLRDFRRALDTDVTRYFPHHTLTVGASFSNEADYISRAVSVKGSQFSEDKNTTWTAGLGFANDTVSASTGRVRGENKQLVDALFGLTQVISSNDIVQLNAGFSHAHGYLSDPYKAFEKRPDERNTYTLLTRWNHHVNATGGSARFSYRFFADSWKIRAHTFSAEYTQPFAQGWSVTPILRLYTQSAASFYVDADPSIYPFAPNPPAGAQNYAEDQRISAYGARTLGIKLAKQINDDWEADIKLEQYEQRASWRMFGSGSPGLLPFRARTIQLGLSHQF